MFRESYAKFYTIIVAALSVGFVGMELRPWHPADRLTGMVTLADTSHLMGLGGSELAFFAIGLVVGAAIIGALHQAFQS